MLLFPCPLPAGKSDAARQGFSNLPEISGKGRFLGCNVGVRAIPELIAAGRGLGRAKPRFTSMGTRAFPRWWEPEPRTLSVPGVGLAKFDNQYMGCLLTEQDDGVWGFYRYLVPDPRVFPRSLRVDLQQISGAKAHVLKNLPPQGSPGGEHLPSAVQSRRTRRTTTNYICIEAPQDVCATAYGYRALPSPNCGPLESYEERTHSALAIPADNVGSAEPAARASPGREGIPVKFCSLEAPPYDRGMNYRPFGRTGWKISKSASGRGPSGAPGEAWTTGIFWRPWARRWTAA